MSTLGKPNHCSSSAVRWRTDGEMGDVIDVGAVVKHLNQFGGRARVILGGGVQLGYSGSGPAGNDPLVTTPAPAAALQGATAFGFQQKRVQFVKQLKYFIFQWVAGGSSLSISIRFQ